jgi:hypothetical protein
MKTSIITLLLLTFLAFCSHAFADNEVQASVRVPNVYLNGQNGSARFEYSVHTNASETVNVTFNYSLVYLDDAGNQHRKNSWESIQVQGGGSATGSGICPITPGNRLQFVSFTVTSVSAR